jgi:hypothetical protein
VSELNAKTLLYPSNWEIHRCLSIIARSSSMRWVRRFYPGYFLEKKYGEIK